MATKSEFLGSCKWTDFPNQQLIFLSQKRFRLYVHCCYYIRNKEKAPRFLPHERRSELYNFEFNYEFHILKKAIDYPYSVKSIQRIHDLSGHGLAYSSES
jgi:hypothetical protein